MAEKGTIIADQAAGESIATRDAVETDNNGNSRVIQRVDLSLGKIDASLGTPIRTLTNGAYDAPDISSWASEIANNAIDVGDKSTLVVGGVATIASGPIGYLYANILPVLLDESDSVMGFLPVKVIESDIGNYASAYSGTTQYFNYKSWSIEGAYKISLVCGEYSKSSFSGASDTLKLYGWVI